VEAPGPNGQPVTRLAYPYSRRFECRAGRLVISRLGIPLASDVWSQASTPQGVTLYANFKRTDTGARLTLPLWAHGAGARSAGTVAHAATWTGIGSYCYASPAGGGRLYLDVDESLPFGAAYNGSEWVQVYAYAQNYRGGYGPWQRSSNTLTYIARPNGATTSGYSIGDNVLIVGGTTAPGGSAPYLQWAGQNGYPINPGSYARIALYAWTARTGWRVDWVSTTEYDAPAQPFNEWCYVP
jgi:hypothetical protein